MPQTPEFPDLVRTVNAVLEVLCCSRNAWLALQSLDPNFSAGQPATEVPPPTQPAVGSERGGLCEAEPITATDNFKAEDQTTAPDGPFVDEAAVTPQATEVDPLVEDFPVTKAMTDGPSEQRMSQLSQSMSEDDDGECGGPPMIPTFSAPVFSRSRGALGSASPTSGLQIPILIARRQRVLDQLQVSPTRATLRRAFTEDMDGLLLDEGRCSRPEQLEKRSQWVHRPVGIAEPELVLLRSIHQQAALVEGPCKIILRGAGHFQTQTCYMVALPASDGHWGAGSSSSAPARQSLLLWQQGRLTCWRDVISFRRSGELLWTVLLISIGQVTWEEETFEVIVRPKEGDEPFNLVLIFETPRAAERWSLALLKMLRLIHQIASKRPPVRVGT